MERDDLALILDVHRTPNPFGKGELNAMETLALAAYEPPCFKHVVVNLRGMNGNAMVIVGNVKLALKRAGASQLDLALFVGEALSGNYENVLATVVKWVTVTDEVPKPTDDAWGAMMKIVTERHSQEDDAEEEE